MPDLDVTFDTMRTVERTSRANSIRPEWMVLASVCFAAAGQLTLKTGLMHRIAAVSDPASAAVILLGLGMYGIGTLLWIQAVSRAEISYLYPLSAINYPLVALGGKLLFHEPVPRGRWIGILVMSVGLALLAASSDRSRA